MVLKVASDTITHKSDVGGVAVDLRTEEDVYAAFQKIETSIAGHGLSDHWNGVTVQKAINWWPEDVRTLGVDLYQPHTYQLRLHWVDEQNWLGVVSVDGQAPAFMNLPPLGPLELHIWGDNYLLGSSWKGIPEISFQYGDEKWIRFEQVSAWTEKVQE